MSLSSDLQRYRRDRDMQRSLEIAEQSLVHASALDSTSRNSAMLAEQIADDISRMAAVADWAMGSIAEHLADTADRLGGIEQMLASPTETAAAEFYRRGSFALRSGWLEEAEADLCAAVDAYPYNPRSWFNLGVARQRANSTEAAAEAYGLCARYGARSDPSLTARAVLLAAYLHRAAKRPDLSAAMLRDYANQIGSCAELHLAAGVHHADRYHLIQALVLAPETAVDARVAGAAELQVAAAEVSQMREGPVHRLRAVEGLVAQLAEAAHNAGFSDLGTVPGPLDLPSDRVDALLLAHRALPSALNVVSDVAAEIDGECARRRAAATAAAKDRDGALAELLEASTLASDLDSLAPSLAGAVVQMMEAAATPFELEQARQQEEQTRQEAADARAKAIGAEAHAVRAGEQFAQSRSAAANAEELVKNENRRIRDQALTEIEGRLRENLKKNHHIAESVVQHAKHVLDTAQTTTSAAMRQWVMDAQARYDEFSQEHPINWNAKDNRKRRAIEETRMALYHAIGTAKSTHAPPEMQAEVTAAAEAWQLAKRTADEARSNDPTPGNYEAQAKLRSAVEAAMAEWDLESECNRVVQPNRFRQLAEQTRYEVARAEEQAVKARKEAEAADREAHETAGLVDRLAVKAADAERTVQDLQRAWERVENTAVRVLSKNAAISEVRDIRQRNESGRPDEEGRLDRLTEEFWALLVGPAVQRLKEAERNNRNAAALVEKSVRYSDQGAVVNSLAKSSIEAAKQIMTRPRLILPFSRAGSLRHFVELETEARDHPG